MIFVEKNSKENERKSALGELLELYGYTYRDRDLARKPGKHYVYEYVIMRKRVDIAVFDGEEPIAMIEIHGGVWNKKGHTSGKSITRDAHKSNLIQVLWRREGFAPYMLVFTSLHFDKERAELNKTMEDVFG